MVGLGSWVPGRQSNPRWPGETARAKGDDLARKLYFHNNDFALQARSAQVAADKNVLPCRWPLRGFYLDQAVAAAEIPVGLDEMQYLEEA